MLREEFKCGLLGHLCHRCVHVRQGTQSCVKARMTWSRSRFQFLKGSWTGLLNMNVDRERLSVQLDSIRSSERE